MIRVVARGVFRPGTVEQALQIYMQLAAQSRLEEGCLEYVVCRDMADQQVLTVLESWRSEQALQAHMVSPHFTRLVPRLAELRESTELARYLPVI